MYCRGSDIALVTGSHRDVGLSWVIGGVTVDESLQVAMVDRCWECSSIDVLKSLDVAVL